jgi:hypothetical protein
METPTTLDVITAVGAIATPILVLVLGGLGWVIKSRIEKSIKQEEALRADRVAVYNQVLEPFIIMFMKEEFLRSDPKYKGKTKDMAIGETINSVSYRQAAFRLALMGSDSVLRAFNELMQFFYQPGVDVVIKSDPKRSMELLGDFLLEIRKSVGNETTTIQNLEMLEWFINDIRKFKKNGRY